MKILHITPFYEPHLGGVETHVSAVSQELLKRGHEVSVLTQRHDVSLPYSEVIDEVKITRIDTEIKHYSKINYKITVWKQVAKHSQLLLKADVIHVHDVYWWLIPLLPLFWTKIFLTFHGWEGVYPVPWSHKLARWLWSKLALKTVHVGKYIQEFYWDEPDAITYGGVDVKKESLKKKAKGLEVVFVGRLEAENDIEKYLELAKELRKNQKIKIFWVGDGEYKAECQKYGQVTGMVKDVSKYLIKADLVWAASYLSILEAQAKGKVVCAFYSHLLKRRYFETFPGSKLMLIGSSVKEMSDQISKLTKDSKILEKYSTNAKKWATEQSWAKVADIYEILWGRE